MSISNSTIGQTRQRADNQYQNLTVMDTLRTSNLYASHIRSNRVETRWLTLNQRVTLDAVDSAEPPYSVVFPATPGLPNDVLGIDSVAGSNVQLAWASLSSLTLNSANKLLVHKGDVMVGKVYDTIKGALDYINAQGSGPTSRWTIEILPGRYEEDGDLVIPSYVTVRGEFTLSVVVTLKPGVTNKHIFRLSNRTDLYYLTIQGPTSPGYAGVFVEDTGIGTFIQNIRFTWCDIGLLVRPATNLIAYTYVRQCLFNGNSTHQAVYDSTQSGSKVIAFEWNNVYYAPSPPIPDPDPFDVLLDIRGNNTTVSLVGDDFERDMVSVDVAAMGTHIRVANSARLTCQACQFYWADQAIVGIDLSTIVLETPTFTDCRENLNIGLTVQGYLNGYSPILKTIIVFDSPFVTVGKPRSQVTVGSSLEYDFQDIAEAVTYAATTLNSSETRPLSISIAAGDYPVSVTLQIPNYCDVIGANRTTTRLYTTAHNIDLIWAGYKSTVRSLSCWAELPSVTNQNGFALSGNTATGISFYGTTMADLPSVLSDVLVGGFQTNIGVYTLINRLNDVYWNNVYFEEYRNTRNCIRIVSSQESQTHTWVNNMMYQPQWIVFPIYQASATFTVSSILLLVSTPNITQTLVDGDTLQVESLTDASGSNVTQVESTVFTVVGSPVIVGSYANYTLTATVVIASPPANFSNVLQPPTCHMYNHGVFDNFALLEGNEHENHSIHDWNNAIISPEGTDNAASLKRYTLGLTTLAASSNLLTVLVATADLSKLIFFDVGDRIFLSSTSHASANQKYYVVLSVTSPQMVLQLDTGSPVSDTGFIASVGTLYNLKGQAISIPDSKGVFVRQGQLSMRNFVLQNFNVGFQTEGSNITIDLRAFRILNCPQSLIIVSADTRGSISGTMDRATFTCASPFLSIMSTDNDGDGTLLGGSIFQKSNSTIDPALNPQTNISPQINEAGVTGNLTGGLVTVSSGRTINISAGHGYITDGDELIYLEFGPFLATAPSWQRSYVSITPAKVVQFTTSMPDVLQTIYLCQVVTDLNSILLIEQPTTLGMAASAYLPVRLNQVLESSFNSVVIAGLIVTAFGSNQISIGSGSYNYGVKSFYPYTVSPATNILAIYDNTSATSVDGLYGINTLMSGAMPTTYNSSDGVLSPISSGFFAKHAIYNNADGINQRTLLVYATTQWSTVGAAESADLPPRPNIFGDEVILLASVVVNNTGVVQSVQDQRPIFISRTGTATAVTNHSNLFNLDVDDHKQYLLVNGSRAMTGSLDMATHPIINSGTINGINIASHASRHQPGGTDPLPTGTAVTIGTSNAEGIAVAFARSDHVHSHGSQGGGTLHAVATTSVSGFMSDVDKTKLDTFGVETTYVLRNGTRAMTGGLDMGTNTIANVTTINTIPAALATTTTDGFMSTADKAKLDTFGLETTYLLRNGTRAMTGSLNMGTNTITNVTTINTFPAALATGSDNGFMSAGDKAKIDTFGLETTYLLRNGTRAMTGGLDMGTNTITNVTTINTIPAALVTTLADGFMRAVDKAKIDTFGFETTYFLHDGTRPMTGTLNLNTNAMTNVTTINTIPAALVTTLADGFMRSTDKAKLDTFGLETTYMLLNGTRAMTGGLNMGTNALTNVTTINAIPAALATTTTDGFMSAGDKEKIDTFGTETNYLLRNGTRAMTGGLNMGTNALTNVTTINAIPAALVTTLADGFMRAIDKSKLDAFGTESNYFLRNGTRAMTGALDLGTNALTNVTTINTIPASLATSTTDGFMSGSDKAKIDTFGTESNYFLRDGSRAMTGALTGVSDITTSSGLMRTFAMKGTNTNVIDMSTATVSSSIIMFNGSITGITMLGSFEVALATPTADGFMSLADKTKLNTFGTETNYLLRNGTRAMTGSLNMGSFNITSVSLLNGIDMTPTGAPSSVGTSNLAGTGTTYARIDHVHDHGSQGGGTLHAVATTSVAGFMSSTDKTKLDAFSAETAYLLVNGTRAMTGGLNMGTNTITNVTTLNGITMTPTGTPASVGTSNTSGVGTTYARIDHVHAHGTQSGGTLHDTATYATAGFMSAADKVKLDSLNTDASFEAVSQNLGDYNKTFAYSGETLTSITYTKGMETIVKTFNYTGPNLTSMVLSGDTPGGIPLTKTFGYTGDKLTTITYS